MVIIIAITHQPALLPDLPHRPDQLQRHQLVSQKDLLHQLVRQHQASLLHLHPGQIILHLHPDQIQWDHHVPGVAAEEAEGDKNQLYKKKLSDIQA